MGCFWHRKACQAPWLLTRWLWHWGQTRAEGCHSSMPSLGVTRCFSGKGKKTAWEIWNVCDEATTAFCALAAMPTISTVDKYLGCWSALLSCFTIKLAARNMSTRRASNSSPRVVDQSRLSHQHENPSGNSSTALLTNLASVGAR